MKGKILIYINKSHNISQNNNKIILKSKRLLLIHKIILN